MRVRDLLNVASERLRLSEAVDTDTARLDAQLLLAEVLGKDRTWLYTWDDAPVSAAHQQAFETMLVRREGGEPVAYILGRREFWGLMFECGQQALIPRPETELLVEKILELELPGDARILDLGTGTGAIALALASERPKWRITAVDLSEATLALATRNLQDQGWNNVCLLQSDWFSSLSINEPFDLIVSNPPYVSSDSPYLDQGDVRFEPRLALIAKHSGMSDIFHILSVAQNYLSASGRVFLEHGFDQQEAVANCFRQNGYKDIQCIYDLNRLPRVTRGSASLAG